MYVLKNIGSKISWIGRYILPLGFFGVMLIVFRTQAIDEEAYIILRYARNIADGYGFVWNPGDAPLWGSTSLLWTLLLALGTVGTGLPLQIVTPAMGVGVAICIIIVICHEYPNSLSASIMGSFVAVTSLVGHALVGLDVLLFSLFLLLTYLNRNDGYRLVAFGLILSVTRPEGLLIAGIFILVHLYEKREFRVPLIFGTIGGAMFSLIFIYFGDILPNPLYVKTVAGPDMASLVVGNFQQMYGNLLRFESLIPLVLILVYLVSKATEKEIWKIVVGVLPIIAYSGLYLVIHQTQNVLGRFQFPIVPVLYVICVAGIGGLFLHPKTRTHALVFMILFGLVLFAGYRDTSAKLQSNVEDTNKMEIGLSMSGVTGYTLATTDAGIVPYYSEWRVVDLFGLNDRHIAKQGLSTEYLDGIEIHVFMTHSLTQNWSEMSDDPRFDVINDLVQYFVDARNFSLACVVPYSVGGAVMNYYFVAPSFEGRDNVVDALCLADVTYAFNVLESP